MESDSVCNHASDYDFLIRISSSLPPVVRGFLVRKRFRRIRGLLDRNASAIQAGEWFAVLGQYGGTPSGEGSPMLGQYGGIPSGEGSPMLGQYGGTQSGEGSPMLGQYGGIPSGEGC